MKGKRPDYFLLVILIGIGIVGYFGIKGKIIRYRFYKAESNAKVVDSSGREGNTIVYYLEDGLQVSARNGDRSNGEIDINTGDSIVKEANSWHFKVFKQDVIGKYQFYREYDYKKDY